jgi:hypothetical protein
MAFDPNDTLCEAIREHGISADRTDEGVSVPRAGLLGSAAIVRVDKHPNLVVTQLDVRFRSGRLAGRTLIESIAGWDEEEEQAAKFAFSKFLQASFHVIMAVLVEEEQGCDQVEWEEWRKTENAWRVCLGPLTLQGSPPEELEVGDLLDQVRDRLVLNLSRQIHWVRLYVSRKVVGSPTSEALLDNVQWAAGLDLVESWNWPVGDYSARLFLMLVPA